MRLLNTKSAPLRIVEFVGSEVPPYVVLSHCWDEGEVSLQDMQTKYAEAKKKKGFAKIKACVKQAREDGFDYAWVDTCCIDKTNSAELSEAINSMYRWYKNADICYAYLADVPSKWDVISRTEEVLDPKGYFNQSKWFTRGWTLQELIAPPVVDFFSADWLHIGTKYTFAAEISTNTNIPEDVLIGDKYLSECSVAERISWAASRTTTRIEDLSYCLMGLFDVTMPLIYGEGEKAFLRLQEEILKGQDDFTLLAWALWDPSNTPHMSEAIKNSVQEHCAPLAQSPSQFTNGKNPQEKYSHLKVTPFDLAVQAKVLPSVTHRGLLLTLPMMQVGESSQHLAYLGCELEGKMLCIRLTQNYIGGFSRVVGGYHLISGESTEFQVKQIFIEKWKPLQVSPWRRTLPQLPLKGYSTSKEFCELKIDVRELRHCSAWKKEYSSAGSSNNCEEYIVTRWKSAGNRFKGSYHDKDEFYYTFHLLPCVTDFQDLLVFFFDEFGVFIMPADKADLELSSTTAQDLATELIKAKVEDQLNSDPNQFHGYVSKTDRFVHRFSHCAISAAYKQGRGGARIVLSSWEIEN